MKIVLKRNAEEIVLELAGRLDTTTAPALDKTIVENINGIKNLILDFYESDLGIGVWNIGFYGLSPRSAVIKTFAYVQVATTTPRIS